MAGLLVFFLIFAPVCILVFIVFRICGICIHSWDLWEILRTGDTINPKGIANGRYVLIKRTCTKCRKVQLEYVTAK